MSRLQFDDLRFYFFVFFVDITYDHLDQVFQSDHTGYAAVFIDQYSQFFFFLLHFPEKGVCTPVFRNEISRC